MVHNGELLRLFSFKGVKGSEGVQEGIMCQQQLSMGLDGKSLEAISLVRKLYHSPHKK